MSNNNNVKFALEEILFRGSYPELWDNLGKSGTAGRSAQRGLGVSVLALATYWRETQVANKLPHSFASVLLMRVYFVDIKLDKRS